MKYEIEIHALRPDGLARNGEPAKVFTVRADCGIDHLAEMYQILTGMTGLHRESLADLHNTAVNRLFDEAVRECNRRLSPDYRDDEETPDAIKHGKQLAEVLTGIYVGDWQCNLDTLAAVRYFKQFEETAQ